MRIFNGEVELDNGTNGAAKPEANGRAQKFAPQFHISVLEVLVGLLFLGTWVVLFAAGGIIGTQPYRDRLTHPENFTVALQLWFVVLTCYTATNVAALCFLSSYLGTLGRRTRIGGQERNDVRADAFGQYTAAVMRGFFVYVGMVSGTVALTGPQTFTNTSPETYLRLAATASLISFLAGYKPQLFSRLQGRLDDMVADKPTVSEHSQTTMVTEHTTRAVVDKEKSVIAADNRDR